MFIRYIQFLFLHFKKKLIMFTNKICSSIRNTDLCQALLQFIIYISIHISIHLSFYLHRNRYFVRKWFSISALDYDDVIYINAASLTLKPLDTMYHSVFRFITGNSSRLYPLWWIELVILDRKATFINLQGHCWKIFILYSGSYQTCSNDWLMN